MKKRAGDLIAETTFAGPVHSNSSDSTTTSKRIRNSNEVEDDVDVEREVEDSNNDSLNNTNNNSLGDLASLLQLLDADADAKKFVAFGAAFGMFMGKSLQPSRSRAQIRQGAILDGRGAREALARARAQTAEARNEEYTRNLQAMSGLFKNPLNVPAPLAARDTALAQQQGEEQEEEQNE